MDVSQELITLAQNAFQTRPFEETPNYIKFGYPERGWSYDAPNKKWLPALFPTTPKGFSGGGCFCVYKDDSRTLSLISYRLFGIQSCWSEGGRYVKAVPIKLWCDLLLSHGYTP